MKTKYLFVILTMTLLAACKPEIDEFTPSKGEADFSRYIAVGDFWTAGFAILNPYFGRFATTPMTSVIEEIPPVNATFFTLWLGMFDIQYYAMLGGTGDVITPVPQFAGSMQAVIDVLTANGARGAIANIPDILYAPYFRTIPYNALPVTDQATADLLNGAYAGLNQIIKGAGSDDTIHFTHGPNPLVIQDAV